ncbi:MAG: YdiU family protein, partial [Limnohabitans sp.]|nr:YdiU family protein [Limnohabitans sp.]
LVEDLMQLMATEKVDFTLFWRQLSQAVLRQSQANAVTDANWSPVTDLVLDRPRLLAWLERYTARAGQTHLASMGPRMLRTNPKFVLRNHLAEVAIRQAKAGDFSEIDTLYNLLQSPFDEHPGFEAYADLPPDWADQLEISCSS